MIAPLRRRHFATFAVLAVALPTVFAVALASRPDEPDGTWPADLDAPAMGEPVAVLDAPFDRLAATVRRYDGWLELELAEPLRAPDVLAYWTPPGGSGRLDGAFLLGPVSAGRANVYRLPPAAAAAAAAGELVLYSLGHQQTVAIAELPAAGAEGSP